MNNPKLLLEWDDDKIPLFVTVWIQILDTLHVFVRCLFISIWWPGWWVGWDGGWACQQESWHSARQPKVLLVIKRIAFATAKNIKKTCLCNIFTTTCDHLYSVMSERESVIDFTVPYYDLVGITIMMKKPKVRENLDLSRSLQTCFEHDRTNILFTNHNSLFTIRSIHYSLFAQFTIYYSLFNFGTTALICRCRPPSSSSSLSWKSQCGAAFWFAINNQHILAFFF